MSDSDDIHEDWPDDIRHGLERMRHQHETDVLGDAERSLAATNGRAAGKPPAPLEFHPFYRGMPALLDWLNDDSSGWHLQVPRMPKWSLTLQPDPLVMPEHPIVHVPISAQVVTAGMIEPLAVEERS